MKKFIKPILLITLVVILAVLIIVPAKSFAVEIPGQLGKGRFGITCWCLIVPFDCGCGIIDPQ